MFLFLASTAEYMLFVRHPFFYKVADVNYGVGYFLAYPRQAAQRVDGVLRENVKQRAHDRGACKKSHAAEEPDYEVFY
jgi:hypothetical protein